MSAPCHRVTDLTPVTDLAEIWQRIVELGAKSAVVDIEPLVACWHTDLSATGPPLVMTKTGRLREREAGDQRLRRSDCCR